VANAALYLASEQSAQLTGVVIPVDGGTTTGAPVTLMREILSK
jgi:enoyl-[acyl-carrier-protein] reductase (NADH)